MLYAWLVMKKIISNILQSIKPGWHVGFTLCLMIIILPHPRVGIYQCYNFLQLKVLKIFFTVLKIITRPFKKKKKNQNQNYTGYLIRFFHYNYSIKYIRFYLLVFTS